VANYYRDGAHDPSENVDRGIHYSPNSYGGPVANPLYEIARARVEGLVGRYASAYPIEQDYEMARMRYLSYSQKDREFTQKTIITRLGAC